MATHLNGLGWRLGLLALALAGLVACGGGGDDGDDDAAGGSGGSGGSSGGGAGFPTRLPTDAGVGLGLAIVQRTAALLEHELKLTSRVGRGTCVALEVPLSDAEPRAATPSSPPPEATEAALMGCVIAVIDDDADARAATELLLQQQGSRVVVADSGAQALERLEHAGLVPDLVVSDYRLRAGESGIVAIGELRARHGRMLPAILVTGDTAGERLIEAGESGLVVLHKPITPSRLTRAMLDQLA